MTITRLTSIAALTLLAATGCDSFEGPPETSRTASALDQSLAIEKRNAAIVQLVVVTRQTAFAKNGSYLLARPVEGAALDRVLAEISSRK